MRIKCIKNEQWCILLPWNSIFLFVKESFYFVFPLKGLHTERLGNHFNPSPNEVSLRVTASATIKPSVFPSVHKSRQRIQYRRIMIPPAFLCFSWPVCLRVIVLWEPAWLHQRSPTNHCNCVVPKPPSPTLGLNHEIFENVGVKGRGSLAVWCEMWDHTASLTRRADRKPASLPAGGAAGAHGGVLWRRIIMDVRGDIALGADQ